MKEQKSTFTRKKKNDIIFILALLLISCIGAIYLFVFREGGNTVQVTVDGKLYGIYSLSEDITEDIRTGENGASVNRLVISDGKAHVESASCPDGICVSHRPIFRDKESIICLPNKVVITVIIDGEDNSPDIVT